jgi:hypothetical protein
VTLDDTSKKAREVYLQRLKEMTASERLLLGVKLWTAGDSVQRAAARHANPNAGEAEISLGIATTRFGSELAGKAYRKH